MSTIEKELERAWELLEDGDVDSAKRIAEKIAGAGEEPGESALLLAACAREEDDIPAALRLLEDAATSDPEWATPEIWMAEMLGTDPERMTEALEHASRGLELADDEDEFLEALALKAGLEIDLGKIAAARKTLGELPPADAAPLPPELSVEIGHLYLAVGDSVEARNRFQTAADDDQSFGDAWHGVGLAAEAQGDEEGKRRAWLEVLSLDERADLEEAHLSEAEMAEVAEDALAELPERARALIQNVPIVIVDLPSRDDVAKGLDPRLLGLFAGTSYPDSSNLGGPPQLTQILLFRKNLERVAGDPEQLRDEIRTTLLHETGHFFGMDEDDLAEVGLD